MLGRADPIGVDRPYMLGIRFAAPLEQKPLGDGGALGDRSGVDRCRRCRRPRGPTGRRRRSSSPTAARRSSSACSSEMSISWPRPHSAARCAVTLCRSAGALPERPGRRTARRVQAGLGLVVDEQSPDLLERDDADEILDVHAAVAQRAAVAIGLRDLRLERDHPLETRLELAHRSPLAEGLLATGRYLSSPCLSCHYAHPDDACGHPDSRRRHWAGAHRGDAARPRGHRCRVRLGCAEKRAST